MSLLATAQPNEAERNQPMDAAAMRRPASCITRPLHYCADATRCDANEPPATRGCKRRANACRVIVRHSAPSAAGSGSDGLTRRLARTSARPECARLATRCDCAAAESAAYRVRIASAVTGASACRRAHQSCAAHTISTQAISPHRPAPLSKPCRRVGSHRLAHGTARCQLTSAAAHLRIAVPQGVISERAAYVFLPVELVHDRCERAVLVRHLWRRRCCSRASR